MEKVITEINVKPMKIGIDLSKKVVLIDDYLTTISWKTEKLDYGFRTTLIWDSEVVTFRNSKGDIDEYGWDSDSERVSLQFLGYWIMKMVTNVNNYSENQWG
jgi:hypothetical protein